MSRDVPFAAYMAFRPHGSAAVPSRLRAWLTDARVQLVVSVAADATADIVGDPRPYGVKALMGIIPSETYTVWRDQGAGYVAQADWPGTLLRQRWSDILSAVKHKQRIAVLFKGQLPPGARAAPPDARAKSLGPDLAGYVLSNGEFWWPDVKAAQTDRATLQAKLDRLLAVYANLSKGLYSWREEKQEIATTRKQIAAARAWR